MPRRPPSFLLSFEQLSLPLRNAINGSFPPLVIRRTSTLIRSHFPLSEFVLPCTAPGDFFFLLTLNLHTLPCYLPSGFTSFSDEGERHSTPKFLCLWPLFPTSSHPPVSCFSPLNLCSLRIRHTNTLFECRHLLCSQVLSIRK